MTVRTWTCSRRAAGRKCGHVNPRRKQLCQACGKRRPATKRPAHMAALALDYAGFVELNGSDTCGICGRAPTARRKLDRDHCHRTGRARGLLCARCNRALPSWVTVDWLRAAAGYLQRTERA
jgi:hypothetical protein